MKLGAGGRGAMGLPAVAILKIADRAVLGTNYA